MVYLKHKGVNYSAQTMQSIQEMIKTREFENSIFQRNSGFGRSYYARELDNGKVEYKSFWNNGANSKTTLFESKKEFYSQK